MLSATLVVHASEASSSRTFVVGSEVDYPPFALGGPDREPSGFTVELWRAVAAEIGLKYTLVVAPFHDVLSGFKSDEIDILINLAQSDERKQFADFSVPHVKTYGAIFVREQTGEIEVENDLAGRKLVVMEADLAHDYAVEQGWQDNLILVDDTVSGLQILTKGEADAMLVNKIVGLQTLRDSGISGVTALPIQLPFFQKFSFAVRKGDTDTLARINEGLALVKTDGRYDEIHEKWFGVLDPKQVTLGEIMAVAAPHLVLASLLVVIIAAAYIRQTRLLVKLADRTERLQRSQSEVRLLNEELEKRVEERTARLRDANSSLNQEIQMRIRTEDELVQAKLEAEAASAAKSQFLATMSHELRTPMNGVLGFAQLLDYEATTDKQRHYVWLLQQSGEHLLQIINDILDISKIEAGKIELERAPILLERLVKDTIAAQINQAESKGLTLSYQVAPSLPRCVMGDGARIRQVLANLVANAIKFTDYGTVKVLVEVVEPSVRIPVDNTVTLRFSITDTGVGIAPEMQKAIFEPFVQADGSITRAHGGTGLGLAIAKQFVTLMGGDIGVDSEPGCGARFWFVVSLAKSADVSMDRAITAEAVPKLRGRILLAEDNPVNQHVAEEMLQVFGLDVEIATNGNEAVSRWQGGQFDAVLMDCLMPEMDGFEATRQIRQQEAAIGDASIRTPIIAMTANALLGDRDHCLKAGMDDYLPKPFRHVALYRLLKRWLKDSGQEESGEIFRL